jgi:hypothetical protein
LIGDKGYPLIYWIMIPFKEEGWNTQFFNWFIIESIKHKHMYFVVNNVFGILKNTFKEFLGKWKLYVTFIHNLFMCAYILHNLNQPIEVSEWISYTKAHAHYWFWIARRYSTSALDVNNWCY